MRPDEETAEAAENSGRACDRCGWPESDPYETVSRHPTSTGVIVYTRCVCGLLHVRLHPHGAGETPGTPIARGARPAVPVTRDTDTPVTHGTAGSTDAPDVDDAGPCDPHHDLTGETEGFGPPRLPRQAGNRR